MRKSKIIKLTEQEIQELLVISRSQKAENRYVLRAKIILMSSEGKTLDYITQTLNCSRATAAKWRKRFHKLRISGLKDSQRPGRETIYTPEEKAEVIRLSCAKPEGGYTRWSQQRIAEKTGISKSHVNRILNEATLKPHKIDQWCGKSTDPEFEVKMVDVIGLYMNPPENALILSVDEKTQIQTLDRTQPELPMIPGKPKRQTNTYKRNGTVSLIASLAVHTGEIVASTIDRNTSDNFLKFLKKLDRKYRNKHLHIILDNLIIHKNDKIKEWLKHKRKFTFHFTPTYSSWLNMIEIWFGILTKDVLVGGIWESKKQLIDQLMEYIKTYNRTRAKPFEWTYTGKPLKA